MKSVFIKTDDKDTADRLKKTGFTLLYEENGVFTFLNDVNIVFDSQKAVYTDKLEFDEV